MSKGYKKKIILFQAGTSGHFLANFLSPINDSTVTPNFRVDWKQSNKVIDFVGPSGFKSFNDEQHLALINDWVERQDTVIMISHYLAISNLLKYSDICWIRKIIPSKCVLAYCKNVYFKKQEMEVITYRETPISTQIDSMFMNIVDFYQRNRVDTDRPEGYMIEFDNLYKIDYLVDLFVETNGFFPGEDKINWAKKYIDKQFKIYEYPTSKDMGEIIQSIDPKDIFDLAAVLFVYENNWQTLDQNRLWTIDDFPNSIEESKKFLFENAYNYTFFKE